MPHRDIAAFNFYNGPHVASLSISDDKPAPGFCPPVAGNFNYQLSVFKLTIMKTESVEFEVERIGYAPEQISRYCLIPDEEVIIATKPLGPERKASR